MPQANSIHVLTSLIYGLSAALISASGPGYAQARPQDIPYDYSGCRDNPCQVAHLNSVEDFCLWAPLQPVLPTTGDAEHTLAAWCVKGSRGTRPIPDGTILGARLVITPEYVQITGVGNFTSVNVPADGVASASGEGNPVHGLVFTRAYGQLEQLHDWTSFVSQERFCFRACKPSAAASTACPPIYDSFGCLENAPGNYHTGVFEDCIGDATELPLTLYQEVLAAPPLYSASSSSGCTTRSTINNAQFARVRRAIVSTSSSSTLATSFFRWHSRSHRYNTPSGSSTATTTTDAATTITFPSFPTSISAATTFMNYSTPLSPVTSTPYSYNYTLTHSDSHWHSHTDRHSRHYPSVTSFLSSSFSSISSSSSFALTFSTYSSGAPSFASSTFASTPTLASMPTSQPFFPSSSDGTSPSLPSSAQPSSFTSSPISPSASSTSFILSSSNETSSAQPSQPSSTPSSTATSALSLVSSPIASLTSSPSSDVHTFTTSPSSSFYSTSSSTTSSPTSPNSQTQLGSQCPPPSQVAVNAGSVVPLPAPLFPLMSAILTVVISSSVGILVS